MALAERLSAPAARDLLRGLMGFGGTERVRQLQQLLIERLNGRRPQRARRLFTSLVDPFLVDDPVLLAYPQPYAFHRADVAGLWYGLGRLAFPTEAVETARLLDRLCLDRLVDDALVQPEALAARERLRVAALAHLDAVLHDPAAADRFLAVVEPARRREFDRDGGLGQPLALLSRHHLQQFRAALVAAPILIRDLPALLAAVPDDAPPVIAAEALAEGEYRLAATLRAAGLPPDAAHALPMTLVNRRCQYTAVGAWLARVGPDAGQMVGEALIAHAGAVAAVMAEGLTAVGRQARWTERPIFIAAGDRVRLDHLVGRLAAAVSGIRLAGLADRLDERIRLAEAVGEPLRLMAETMLPGLGLRLSTCLLHRFDPAADQDAVIWLCGQVIRVEAILSPLGLPTSAYAAFRHQSAADADFAAHKVTRLPAETAAEHAERFGHLTRIEQLANAVGISIAGSLSATSRNAQQIIAVRLADPRPLEPAERDLVTGFVTCVRAEIAKIKYWRNPELVELSDRAEEHGL